MPSTRGHYLSCDWLHMQQECLTLNISLPPWHKQGKSEGFDSCERPSNLKLDSNRQFCHPCDREIWWMTSKNKRALLLYYVKLCASFQIHWWIQTGFTVEKPCDLEILRMTLKNNRASLLSYFKLCASFRTLWWIQIIVTVRKRPIWVKFDDF